MERIPLQTHPPVLPEGPQTTPTVDDKGCIHVPAEIVYDPNLGVLHVHTRLGNDAFAPVANLLQPTPISVVGLDREYDLRQHVIDANVRAGIASVV